MRRSERVEIRLTPDEKETLIKVALYTRQSVSGFIMVAALAHAEKLLVEKDRQGDLL